VIGIDIGIDAPRFSLLSVGDVVWGV